MKNKTLVYIIVSLIIILGIAAGIYFTGENEFPGSESAEERTVASSNGLEGEESSLPGSETGPRAQKEKKENILVKDNFSVNIPEGWIEVAASVGVSAMVVNTNEEMTDPAAKKINFKSYFAVSYDMLQGKTISEYLQTVKSGIEQTIPNVVFTKDQDTTIGGRSAHAIESELAQQGVDFKVLIVVVKGQGDNVWVISFNTTKSSWDGYKETFYSIADSFSLKN